MSELPITSNTSKEPKVIKLVNIEEGGIYNNTRHAKFSFEAEVANAIVQGTGRLGTTNFKLDMSSLISIIQNSQGKDDNVKMYINEVRTVNKALKMQMKHLNETFVKETIQMCQLLRDAHNLRMFNLYVARLEISDWIQDI